MRIRTAKKLAQRIDLNYFKRAHGLRRWRFVLSVAVPAAALIWIASYAAAGSRKPYSAGPVSKAHAFTEMKCEVCHARQSAIRAHVPDTACLTCHDAPTHAANQTRTPACSSCHLEHSGRVQLARVDDRFCVDCHGDLDTTVHTTSVARRVGAFPLDHPEFAPARVGVRDPGGLKFNHAVHLKKDGVRGPTGIEHLECGQCHKPEVARTVGRRVLKTGLMTSPTYADACSRCHPLYFDELIDASVPHDRQPVVKDFVIQSLTRYIAQHPDEIGRPAGIRRVPLNFPRPPEPPARGAAEWVARRQAADERVLWNKTCAECHQPSARDVPKPGWEGVPAFEESRITARWMPRASFDHAPHAAVRCTECHAAENSRLTSDVLMPNTATCATCHAPGRGAETGCFECHQYHDWTKTHAVTPGLRLSDFK